MADIDLKTSTPDTSLPTTGFLFGADSQAASAPSVFTTQAVATTLLGSTTLSGATITADAPVLNMSQTWNNAAVTFTGLKFNATDTASAAASLLLDIGTGGGTYVSRFRVKKDGGGVFNYTLEVGSGTFAITTGFNSVLWGSGAYGWTSGNSTAGSTPDTILTRRAAANLRFGAADAATPVAQTLSVQSVVAGTTNTAGANLTITGSQGTGTGAGGSIIFQVAPAGSSGSAQNALTDALTITSNRRVTVAENIVGPLGNTGAVLGGLVLGFSGVSTGNIAGGQIQLFEAGTLRFRITDTALNMYNSAELSWSSATGAGGTADVRLFRDAANTLALRNGNEGQTFRLYGRFTDITNDFERFFINAPTTSGAAVLFGTQKGATAGTARALALQTDGTTRASWAANGTVTFNNNSSYTIDQFNNITWGFNLISGTSMRANLLEIGNASDTILTRDNTAILAQRNGTNAQEFRWYRTFTDSSNRQNGALKTAASEIIIEAQTAGTGADDIDVTLTPAGTGNVRFGTHTATSDTAVSGYIEIKDAGGTIRKLAIIT